MFFVLFYIVFFIVLFIVLFLNLLVIFKIEMWIEMWINANQFSFKKQIRPESVAFLLLSRMDICLMIFLFLLVTTWIEIFEIFYDRKAEEE